MGWRAQDAWDKDREEADRQWVASLPPRDRLRFRVWQISGLGILICVVALIVLTVIEARGEAIQPGAIEVTDGDTIRISGQRYRLVGFDTPEPEPKARCEEERALASRATFRLQELVSGGGLEFERVACACRAGTEGTQACNQGRLCGSLRSGGRDVGAILISEGLARRYVCRATSCPRRAGWC